MPSQGSQGGSGTSKGGSGPSKGGSGPSNGGSGPSKGSNYPKPQVSNSGTKSNDKMRSKENDSGYWPKSAVKGTGKRADTRYW